MTWCFVPETEYPYAPVVEVLNSGCTLPSRISRAAALLSGKKTPKPFLWAEWFPMPWTSWPEALQLVVCLSILLRFNSIRPSPDAMPDLSNRPQCGTMCEPSLVMVGAGISTSSVRGILASRSAPPESVLAAMTQDTCGPMLPASCGKPGPNGGSLKTSPGTSASVLKPCCETYGTWAGRLRLAYSRRLKQERRTNDSGFSSWPTASHFNQDGQPIMGASWPTADATFMSRSPATIAKSAKFRAGNGQKTVPMYLTDAAENWPTPTAKSQAQTSSNPTPNQTGGTTLAGAAEQLWMTPDTPSGGRSMPEGTSMTGMTPEGRKITVGMENQAKLWTTPQAHDVTMRGSGQVPTAKAGNACLATDAAMWGTPRGSDGEKGGPNQSFGGGGTPLRSKAAHWPTATGRDHKGSSSTSVTRKDGKSSLDLLDYAAEQGFHHPDHPTAPHGVTSCAWRPISRRLLRSAILSVEPTTLRRWLRRGAWRKRRLNPIFVEWLMRWPPGHGLCDCTETEWTQWLQHMRGALSQRPTACGPWIWKPPTEEPAPTQIDMFL